jgi:hypothetical protein
MVELPQVGLTPSILKRLHDLAGEAEAMERRRPRRARLTGIAICARATKLREYIGKINEADIKLLRHDPIIGEAISNLTALAGELCALASALEPEPRVSGYARHAVQTQEPRYLGRSEAFHLGEPTGT